MTILILTPLPIEFQAVVCHLSNNRKSIVKNSAAYEIGDFSGNQGHAKIIIREPGMRVVDMAIATERAIQEYKPQIALLVGIAGE